jgi:putative phosphoesterase
MHSALVISDSHGNQKLLRQVLRQEQNVDFIIHLGDFYGDLEGNEDFTKNKVLIRVPGIMNPGYFNARLPVYQIVEISGWQIGCIHSPQDIPQIWQEVEIILYGHTHSPIIKRQFDKLEINPGHLKKEEDRGNIASYALLNFSEDEVYIEIKDYNCNLKDSFTLLKRK